MSNAAAMSKLIQALTPRSSTPDLTPLGLTDAARPQTATHLRRQPARSVSQQCLREGAHTPVGAAPLSPPLRLPLRPRPSFGGEAPLLAKAGHLASSLEPPLSRAATAPPQRPAPDAPIVLAPVAPLRTVSSAHQWLARYLLREPGVWGAEQCLAEDMMGAGILRTSVVGASPLTQDLVAQSHRPLLNEFKAFVEGLGAWCAAAPRDNVASYRVAALRIGSACMHHLRTLDLSCLGLLSLPHEIGLLNQLQSLELQRNALRTLPPSCAGLKALREVDLRYNPLLTLPAAMARLPAEHVRCDASVLRHPVLVDGRF